MAVEATRRAVAATKASFEEDATEDPNMVALGIGVKRSDGVVLYAYVWELSFNERRRSTCWGTVGLFAVEAVVSVGRVSLRKESREEEVAGNAVSVGRGVWVFFESECGWRTRASWCSLVVAAAAALLSKEADLSMRRGKVKK